MSYYDKKTVYGDSPLKEIIYELEDSVQYNTTLDIKYISEEDISDIIIRHNETVNEFKNRI